MRRSAFVLGTVIALAVLASAAWADAIPLDRITSNAPDDLSGQLSVEVMDGGAGYAVFVIRNASGGIASSITEIYWGPVGASNTYLDTTPTPPVDFVPYDAGNASGTSSSGVDYCEDSCSGNDGPPGMKNTLQWDSRAQAQPDSAGGRIDNGIQVGEKGVFGIKLADSWDWSDIETAILDGELIVALHVQGIGPYSDTYATTTPVPEPATIGLLGLGFGGLIVLARRRARA